MASNVQRGPSKMDAGDWIRMKKLASLTRLDNKSLTANSAAARSTHPVQKGARLFAEFGNPKAQRPASLWSDYKARSTGDYVLQSSSGTCGPAKALISYRICDCASANIIKARYGICRSCTHDKIQNR